MSWFTEMRDGVFTVAKTAAASLTKFYTILKANFGLQYSDAQVDEQAARIEALIPKVRDLIAQEIDDIPGVPTVLADLAAQLVGRLLDAGLAGSIEAAKQINGDD